MSNPGNKTRDRVRLMDASASRGLQTLTGLGLAMMILCTSAFAAEPPAKRSAKPASPAATPSKAPRQPEPVMDAPLVDWSHAQQAHRLIEKWVAAAKVTEEDSEPIRVAGLSAVRVTLRWGGVPMGVGEVEVPTTLSYFLNSSSASRDRAASPIPATDLLPAVARATSLALRDVSENLTDSRIRASQNQPENVHKGTRTLADICPQLQVDLQLATPLEPIRLVGPADSLEVFTRFVPGFHGLRMASAGDSPIQAPAGDRNNKDRARATSAWIWPGSALANNLAPRLQIVQLLAELEMTVQDIPRIARPGGPTLARFNVIHMTRPAANEPVFKLVRGNVLLPPNPIDSRTVDAMAERLTSFLIRRLRDDGVMTGTYHPSTDRFDPPTAQRQDAALAAYALGRQAAHQQAMQAPDADLTLQAIKRMLAPLLKNLLAESRSDDPAAAALVVMTINETPGLEERKRDRDLLVDQLLKMRNDDGWFRTAMAPDAQTVNGPTQALIVAALASYFSQTRNVNLGQIVRQSQTLLWAQPDLPTLTGMLPWLMMGEASMRPADDPKDAATQARFEARVKALRELIDALHGRLIWKVPADMPEDVIGGYDLVDKPVDAFPSPDWRSAQVMAFQAIALRHKRLTGPEQTIKRVLDCGLTGRFIAQMMFDEPACFYVRGREQVMGGVRLAPWDNRLGPMASAMSLLAVTELQRSLQQMSLPAESP